MVENDSLSEKQITTSVPVRLRPGFPAEFRTFAKFGRKEGMRGKPTYFYSMVMIIVLLFYYRGVSRNLLEKTGQLLLRLVSNQLGVALELE